jgi:prepilin-type processing-associated H-X9-DG protein
MAIIGALVGLLLPAVQAARESGRRMTCQNNLKQMGIALHNYHSTYEVFPLGVASAAGGNYDDDGFGWAVSLLPHLEEQALFDLINPDWLPGVFSRTYVATRKIIPGGDTVLPIFRCPTSELPAQIERGLPFYQGYATSDYKACNGKGDSGMFYKVSDGKAAGYLRVRIPDVTDGLSQTIALGESSYYHLNDIADWPIWIGTPGTDEAVLFKTQDPSVINCRVHPKSTAGFRTAVDDDCAFSWHNEGAYFAFADGSVHFLFESIDFTVYESLGTKNDGNVISDF